MRLFTLKVATIALAASAFGCSSDGGDEGGGTDPLVNDWGPAAEPCGINTGYEGDEYCIKPPPDGMGFQMHYGPKNYTNAADVQPFLIQPGEEVTDCVLVDLPNETEVFFNEYHGRMRPGSHHMLLYVLDDVDGATIPDSDRPQLGCSNGVNQRNIFGSQEPIIDVKRTNGAPENDGLAVRLGPRQQGIMQLHFINTTDEPMLREAWANVMYIDPSLVKQVGDPIFFIGGYGMNVAPGETAILKGSATVPATAPDGVRLVMGTGHYHAHTVRFTAYKTIGGQRSLLMEDYDYHDPALISFDSRTQNVSPDPSSKIAGGLSGVQHFMPGDSIDWECEVDNTVNNSNSVEPSQTPLTFGNEVYESEMCNMFGMYAPTMGGAWFGVGF